MKVYISVFDIKPHISLSHAIYAHMKILNNNNNNNYNS